MQLTQSIADTVPATWSYTKGMEIKMTDQELNIQTEEIQNDSRDTYHRHRYEPTPYEVLDELFSHYTPVEDDVIVDYGCGLGRLNFYLEKRFSLRSTGVEYSEIYYRRALENKERYSGKKDNINFVHCAAEDYVVSTRETVFYFFNPFSVDVFRRVINRILLSWQETPRTLTLILYYPEDETVFYLENHTSFQLVDEIAAGEQVRSDRRERFCLYRLGTLL